jgi:hypothetical protein
MTDDKLSSLAPEPAANQGFARLNWRSQVEGRRRVLLFALPESDGVRDVTSAMGELGYTLSVWEPDLERLRHGRVRLDELTRFAGEARKAGDAPWAGVLPFHRQLVRQAADTFPGAAVVLIFDDALVLGVAGEALADATHFLATTRLEAMAFSMRKAKEFPEATVQALADFAGERPTLHQLANAAMRLGRPQLRLAQRPVRKALIGGVKFGLDGIYKHGRVSGWVRRVLSDERLEVRAVIGGDEVARVLADVYRPDLEQAGGGDGAHGFVIDLGQVVGTEPVRVAVRTVEGDIQLGLIDLTRDWGKTVVQDERVNRSAAE